MATQAKLLDEFPPVSTAEWMAVVEKDLKGADFSKKLVWQTDEGIAVRPFYRAEDLNGLETLPPKPDNNWEIREAPVAGPHVVAAHRFHDAGGTVVQELGYGIAEAIGRLPVAAEFSFAIGSNFFFEIAKLRAARLLWSRVCDAKMIIHARTSRWNKTIYDPYNNVLRATTEAMSAAIGGCDTLFVAPFDSVYREPEGDSRRLARNTQLILKHEAWFDRVVDPAGGSYYVEVLTDSIAREAWKLVEEVQAAGGFTRAGAGIDAGIAKSRAKKEAAVASRRQTVVGTNNYPNTKERMLDRVQEISGPRAAEAFEQIRLATERSGKTPKFLLAEIGDLKMRKARSGFIRNFLGCGGFDIHAESFASAEDAAKAAVEQKADAVALCSSDAEYAQLAPALVGALKAAGSTAPVIIAGPPQDSLSGMDFIHLRSNAVETLRAWGKE